MASPLEDEPPNSQQQERAELDGEVKRSKFEKPPIGTERQFMPTRELVHAQCEKAEAHDPTGSYSRSKEPEPSPPFARGCQEPREEDDSKPHHRNQAPQCIGSEDNSQ